MHKKLLLPSLLLGSALFIHARVATAQALEPSVGGPMEGAVDVEQDLALMPSGVLVSLKTGQSFEGWGPFAKVEGNSSAGCGVLRDGSVTCWKLDAAGHPLAFRLERLGRVSSVAGSPDAGCAARKDGKVTCWDREDKERSQGPIAKTEPVFAGLDEVSTPKPLRYIELPGLGDVVAVTGGRDGCALLRSGTVACWGRHPSRRSASHLAYDVAPTRVQGLTRVRQVVQDGLTRCAVVRSGQILCWGRRFVTGTTTAAEQESPFDERPRRVPGIADAVQVSISTAAESACAARKDGRVVCWGKLSCDGAGADQAAAVPGLGDITKVSVAFPSSCAVHRKGGLHCWPGCPRTATPPR